MDEKPGYYAEIAHGYDVNLQAWIPGYLQLSGRVKFEQYFGDRVAFTKKGQEARNPYALSLGLSYAPIPLLQFDVDRVLGGQKQTENRFGVSVRYQFGVPLSLQLDPTYTASQYLNKATNYHVVDRNSAIVLSFREKPSQRIEKPVIKPTPSGTPARPETPGGKPCIACHGMAGGTEPSVDDEPIEDEDRAVNPKNDAEYPDFHVYPHSPDGKPLKGVPAKQESHAVIDETVSAEGFVIVEPSATERDTPDEQYGFEFVRGS